MVLGEWGGGGGGGGGGVGVLLALLAFLPGAYQVLIILTDETLHCFVG